jgi:hypothetical protein
MLVISYLLEFDSIMVPGTNITPPVASEGYRVTDYRIGVAADGFFVCLDLREFIMDGGKRLCEKRGEGGFCWGGRRS